MFDDITGGGRRLCFLPLPANERGPRVALFGERFYCEAGRDLEHHDTLFVSHVSAVAARRPATGPRTYHAAFTLLTTGGPGPEPFDRVDPLLADSAEGLPAEPAGGPPPWEMRGSPGPALLEILQRATEPVRKALRPATDGPAPDIQVARALWSRHGLERLVALSPRATMLFKGQITRDRLDARDHRLLLEAFDYNGLNAMAAIAGARAPALIEEVLLSLPALAAPEAWKASLWAHVCRGLSPAALRRELHEIAADLEGEPPDRAWTRPMLEVLRGVGEGAGDPDLGRVAEAAGLSDVPLEPVLAWAARLQFDEEAAPRRAAPAAPAPVDPAAEPAEAPPPAFGTWVAALRLPPDRTAAELLEGLKAACLDFAGALPAAPLDVPGLLEVAGRLEALRTRLAELGRLLPEPDQVLQDHDEASAAWQAARAVMGPEELGALWRSGQRVSPADLVVVAGLLAHRPLLETLPAWIWQAAETHDPDASELAAGAPLPQRLVPLTVRRRLRSLLSRLPESGAGPALPLSLPPPPPGTDLGPYLEQVLEDLDGAGRLLDEAGPLHAGWVQAALAGGTLPGETAMHLGRAKALADRLSPASAELLTGRLMERPDAPARTLRLFEQAMAFLEREIGPVNELPPAVLARRLSREEEALEQPGAPAAGALAFAHDYVDRRARATLTWKRSERADRPYGTVLVPLCLQADAPGSHELRLEIHLPGGERDGWPEDWEGPHPELLSLRANDWALRPDGRYEHPLTLRLPMRLPARAGKRDLRITLSAVDPVKGTPQVAPVTPSWPLTEWNEPVTVAWPDEIRPEFVETHPIGPQRHGARVLGWISGGSSFAVRAPRRYGKSTLVEYIRRRAAEAPAVVVAPPVVCTTFQTDDGLDLERLWARLSEDLEALSGASLGGERIAGLPAAPALQPVRRALAERGVDTLLLLFDEAQLLFPRESGHVRGDALKDLLERGLSGGGGARVVIGLVGLPSLLDRAGANLMGLLRQVEDWQVHESDLLELTQKMTRGRLQVTTGGRMALATRTDNLFILRQLLERLVTRVNREHRTWVGLPDVLEEVLELRSHLRLGSAETVARYVRDALNDGESINAWRPKAAFATAVALARVQEDGPGTSGAAAPEATIRAVRTWLDGWCRSAATSEPGRTLTYTPERIREHLVTLRDLGVAADGGIRSQLLRSWLLGMAADFPPDEASRDALVRGAVHLIALPKGREEVAHWGAATLYRFAEGGRPFALRTVPLPGEAERARFAALCQSLERVRTLDRGEPGAACIFELERIGLADAQEPLGVQVYRWIDGHALVQHEGALAAPLAADLGWQLALALRALHRVGVVHRDLRPASVLVSDGESRPVLVDFGLTRDAAPEAVIQAAARYAAPEAREASPRWTPAADVYGLGATLAGLLAPGQERLGGLGELLARATAHRPDDRPSSTDVADELYAIRERLHVEVRKSEAWERIEAITVADGRDRRYGAILEKLRPNLVGVLLGLQDRVRGRAVEIARLIDQVLEAHGSSLGRMKYEANGSAPGLSLLHLLRQEGSHHAAHARRPVRGYDDFTDEELRAGVTEGARTVGAHLGLETLGPLAQALLGGFTQ